MARKRVRKDLRLYRHFLELNGEETGEWRGEISAEGDESEGEDAEARQEEDEAEGNGQAASAGNGDEGESDDDETEADRREVKSA